MSFSLSAWFEQLNTAQKLGIFKFLFLFHFVVLFSSLSSRLPAQPLFLIVLHNGVKKHSHEKGMIWDMVLERRIYMCVCVSVCEHGQKLCDILKFSKFYNSRTKSKMNMKFQLSPYLIILQRLEFWFLVKFFVTNTCTYE